MSAPLQRFDFCAAKFPITFEALHPDTRRVVWSKRVEEPADIALLYIPPLRLQLGHRVLIRIRYADGTVEDDGA